MDMEALIATKSTVSVRNKQNVRELQINHFCLYTDVSYKITKEKEITSNKKPLNSLLKLLRINSSGSKSRRRQLEDASSRMYYQDRPQMMTKSKQS